MSLKDQNDFKILAKIFCIDQKYMTIFNNLIHIEISKYTLHDRLNSQIYVVQYMSIHYKVH